MRYATQGTCTPNHALFLEYERHAAEQKSESTSDIAGLVEQRQIHRLAIFDACAELVAAAQTRRGSSPLSLTELIGQILDISQWDINKDDSQPVLGESCRVDIMIAEEFRQATLAGGWFDCTAETEQLTR